MRVDVIMPQMGESVNEGTVTKWLKKVGDHVDADEPLFEISTDKVDAEIPSPTAGYLAEILVPEGKTVAINSKVAVISSEPPEVGTSTTASGATLAAAEATIAATRATTVPEVATRPATAQTQAAPPTAAPGAATPHPAPLSTGTAGPDLAGQSGEEADADVLRRLRSSPLVRKIAQEHQVDIRAIQGTGLSGRVTKKDILEYIERRETIPAASAISAPVEVTQPGTAPTLVAQSGTAPLLTPSAGVPSPGATPVPAPATRPTAPAFSLDVPPHYLPVPGPEDEVAAMSPMRRKISEHMTWSKRLSAHVSTFLEVDMTRIVKLRAAYQDEFSKQAGHKLTYMPFIMQATVAALKAYPDCNASILGEDVIYHKNIHLGMAVALENGLIVPVIRHADEKNLLGLSRALTDLATRARTKKLLPDEVTGGTFSITNFGAFGALGGTPVINQPQVAILGVGAVDKRAWVVEGPEGDAIAIRSIMMLSLSYDHRLVDGATGCRFLDHIKKFLENYEELRISQ